MKRFLLVLALVPAVAVSCGPQKSPAARLVQNYAEVTIPAPDLSGISDNGKEVLNLYRFAADEIDAIYWEQSFGRQFIFDALSDPAEKEYVKINYGPWDRIDGKAFLPGFGPRPAGAGFYPSDMTPEEFEALDDPAKNSPYTLIKRGEDGKLYVQWYHDAYADRLAKVSHYLNAAADITIKESVSKYLKAMANSLLTDNYYAGQRAWLEMTDSKMDLVIGPNESIDDNLYGKKASYGAYVLLKNLDRTAALSKLSARMEEFQQHLPGESKYHAFMPIASKNIFSCNAIYYAGYPNAGYKVIAINFPYDEHLQEELGTRTILFDNIIREKYNRTLFPVGNILFELDDAAHIDASAFYWNIVFREIAKGLGVKETINGKGTVTEALADEALTFEKAKSNVLGVYLCAGEVEEGHVDALVQKNDILATFIANVIRSCRFGTGDATGRANLLIYNYLVENKAIELKASGKYGIDYAKTYEAIESLGAKILKIQATGDYEAARAFVAYYSVMSASLKDDIVNLELEKIPVDIRFTYEK